MKLLIQQNEGTQTNNEFLQTLKWKLENRYSSKLRAYSLLVQQFIVLL